MIESRKQFFTFGDDGFKSTATTINRKNDKKKIESWYALPEKGNNTMIFRTNKGTLFAVGYNRVVYGDRGPYVEFERHHIKPELISVIDNYSDELPIEAYYEWLTIADYSNIKIYAQRRRVKYADYKPGKFYVSPHEILTANAWQESTKSQSTTHDPKGSVLAGQIPSIRLIDYSLPFH